MCCQAGGGPGQLPIRLPGRREEAASPFVAAAGDWGPHAFQPADPQLP